MPMGYTLDEAYEDIQRLKGRIATLEDDKAPALVPEPVALSGASIAADTIPELDAFLAPIPNNVREMLPGLAPQGTQQYVVLEETKAAAKAAGNDAAYRQLERNMNHSRWYGIGMLAGDRDDFFQIGREFVEPTPGSFQPAGALTDTIVFPEGSKVTRATVVDAVRKEIAGLPAVGFWATHDQMSGKGG